MGIGLLFFGVVVGVFDKYGYIGFFNKILLWFLLIFLIIIYFIIGLLFVILCIVLILFEMSVIFIV